ncbi:MAG TPA: hypothetical protein VL460_02050 [Caulobacteraceae bacterium]|jgi:hypothetical protein|nr:hypothetical protein [Caulobacteraceae bacterium]
MRTRYRILGGVMAAAGLVLLAALGFALYDHEASKVLIDLGIPGALLASLAGLSLLLIGVAVAVRRGGRVSRRG